MPDTNPAPSPLACLIRFIVCLAILGSIVAGAHYYAIDLPDQQRASLHAPDNDSLLTKCKNCQLTCSYSSTPAKCLDDCDLIC